MNVVYNKLRRFPKTHSLREFLTGLGKVYKIEKKIEKIKRENINLISDLEQAYFTARYLPVEFTEQQVKIC